jgi:hypothetical protein
MSDGRLAVDSVSRTESSQQTPLTVAERRCREGKTKPHEGEDGHQNQRGENHKGSRGLVWARNQDRRRQRMNSLTWEGAISSAMALWTIAKSAILSS